LSIFAGIVLGAALAPSACGQSAPPPGPMQSGTHVEKPAPSPPPAPAAAAATADPMDVEKLFAGTCGWCHSDGGRVAGKGPQLMGIKLTDAEIIHQIEYGTTGRMPAFRSAFTDAQLQAIVRYIRNLRPSH
jgi:mono/diheme cytochrome c family protein